MAERLYLPFWFDIHAGLKSEGPRSMRPLGLQWLYRLIREPRRLARRYLANNPRFVLGVLRDPPGVREL